MHSSTWSFCDRIEECGDHGGPDGRQFPTNTDVLDAKGRAQTASGDTEGAIATYRRIYELSPNSIPAMTGYVALLREAKEFAKAQTVLQAALSRDPKNDQVKGELIRVEADIGGMRAGLAKARTFAKEDPGNPLYDIVSAELYEGWAPGRRGRLARKGCRRGR